MSAATFATINPATAEQIEAFSYHTASEIEGVSEARGECISFFPEYVYV